MGAATAVVTAAIRSSSRFRPDVVGARAKAWAPPRRIRFAAWIVPRGAPCRGRGRECRWEDARFIAWQAYAQGEYVGHARTEHVPEYRLRVDDQLDMLYRITRDETRGQYKLNVGDEVRVESFTDPELESQPDGAARRHDHASSPGPGPRRGPHGHAVARHAGRAVQEVLQGAFDHGHADEGQHAVGRPAFGGRSPLRRRRPGGQSSAWRPTARSRSPPSATSAPRD